MGYVFPGMKGYICQAAEQLGVHISVGDIEKMPPIRHASALLGQLGTSPDPAALIDGARGALAPCRVAVLAGELLIADLVARDLVPATVLRPVHEPCDPETGVTPSLLESASEAAAAVLAINARKKAGGPH